MTWRVEKVESRRVTLDFTSSGQAPHEAVQVLFDGHLFANAVGLTDWTGDGMQVDVCESCGIEGCNVDGWVQLRSAGDLRVFVPMLRAEADSGDSRQGPPKLLRQQGAPLLQPEGYGRMREIIANLPLDPPAITSGETLRLLAFEAPRRLTDGEGSFRRSLAQFLLAADGCELQEGTASLSRLIENLSANDVSMSARPVRPGERIITFHVDDSKLSAWQPMVLTPSGPAVCWSGWVVEPEAR